MSVDASNSRAQMQWSVDSAGEPVARNVFAQLPEPPGACCGGCEGTHHGRRQGRLVPGGPQLQRLEAAPVRSEGSTVPPILQYEHPYTGSDCCGIRRLLRLGRF